MLLPKFLASAAVLAVSCLVAVGGSIAGQGPKGHSHDNGPRTMDGMREMHRGHAHEHDFEAMQAMSPAQKQRMMRFMMDIGLAVPPMNSKRGRQLFVEKGCVVCHQANKVGGDIGPSLNAADMPSPMNTFEFAARMWRGAAAMVALQEDLIGEVISLNGQELADIIAFAHDDTEQKKLSRDQIPERFRKIIAE